ncbi:Serine/threonine-protein kinase PknD [Rubripirellula obstinata]|uniref:Serine/threonine-protein kinase PknD n=2 Tax=Rubripirellula obstinata TaxID=406547 RepID=A0A5B1CMF2_9BACT|nr:Serine/threonine-protein kinase PknD [Rubripirellula obstinata]
MPYTDGMAESLIVLSATDADLPRNIPAGMERYTGFREMAAGGCSRLRSCYDRVTGRTVAMKSLKIESLFDRRERRRLLREARITAQLQHPNTVPVYDIGEDDKEGVYFIMKRISGENLFEILKRIARGDEATIAAYPIDRRLEIVAGACQALAYAHARGVIHRDVKPENIWVGNFGEVILLDWGVAKVWGAADDESPVRQSTLKPDDGTESQQTSTLTGGGQRPGTPLYMSPEQIRGNRTIDERSDIFSAGVCLYETLAVREPFRGKSVDETFANITGKEVDPPSVVSPQAGIPEFADATVMRAMQKKPGDRFQSMREMLAAIRSEG